MDEPRRVPDRPAGAGAAGGGGGVGRGGIGFRKEATAAAVVLESSSIGEWPSFSKISSLAPLMSSWKRKASAGGTQRSWPPHRIRVGAARRLTGGGASGSRV